MVCGGHRDARVLGFSSCFFLHRDLQSRPAGSQPLQLTLSRSGRWTAPWCMWPARSPQTCWADFLVGSLEWPCPHVDEADVFPAEVTTGGGHGAL